jgi:hypothetical protein
MTVLNSTFVLSSRTPTATGGIDFLDRLRIAERNDGSRSSRLRWHPNVVDRVESAWDVERTCVDDSQITPYSEPEIQEAYGRQMVKTHIRQCLRKADPETRTRYNAVSADEAWRRADALRMELEQAGRSSNDEQSLKQRQREAALRCQEQAMGKAPKPQQIKGRSALTPLSGIAKNFHPDSPGRAPSSRRMPVSAPGKLPGKPVRRQASPRPQQRPSSPRARPQSPRPSGGRQPSPRAASGRVSTPATGRRPPGGASTFVFG